MVKHRNAKRIALYAVLIWPLSLFAEGLIDPTAPIGGGKIVQTTDSGVVVQEREPVLSGIICLSRCRAVLDGETVAVGERVNGYYVASIEPNRVALRRDHRTINLALYPNDIKQ